uniref:E3 ubiquitin-protein ligase synoviolin-B n=1 Tax=Cajanus cajan TaxID=3821 RepID=A0A151TWE9_CAJCA|nr:E3 ubiquitin-protein ligase synoviolin-B [Cajanus cajan]
MLERFKVMDHEMENCMVCLEDFKSGDDAAARLPCTHVCHYHCILGWFVQNATCPVCRFSCTHASS